MQYKSFITLTMTTAMLFLAACASDEEVPTEEQIVDAVEDKKEEVIQSVTEEQQISETDTSEESVTETLLKVKTFYFDYDRSDLRDIAHSALDAHADNILSKLRDEPNAKIIVEGHADDRGTIAYNNALGNRRAESVARYLRVKGVPNANLEVISYGELRPVSEGSGETSWQLNRRAVLHY